MTVAQKAQFLEKPLTRWLEMLGVFGFCRTAAATRPSLSSSVPHLGSKWVELPAEAGGQAGRCGHGAKLQPLTNPCMVCFGPALLGGLCDLGWY